MLKSEEGAAIMSARLDKSWTVLESHQTPEVADVAAFLASDRASAMSGAIANLTCGSLMD